jgi:hypothetical protein
MNRRFASILPRLGVAFVALSGAVFAQGLPARQVAAPADDILSGLVRLPDPAWNPWTSRAAILPLRFERSGAGWAAEVEVPVERVGDLAVVLLSPDAGTWRVLAGAPGASLGPIEDTVPGVERNVAPAGIELPGWIVDRYDLRGAAEGAWNLRVEASDGRRVPAEAWSYRRGIKGRCPNIAC